MVYVWFVLYVGTLAAAVAATPTFIVLDLVGALVFVPSLLVVPLFILREAYLASARLGVALAHVLAAALIHPAMSLSPAHRLGPEEQVEVLERLLTDSQSILEAKRADTVLTLVRSIQQQESLRQRARSPWSYWVPPASVALVVWGCILFFVLPRGGGSAARLWG